MELRSTLSGDGPVYITQNGHLHVLQFLITLNMIFPPAVYSDDRDPNPVLGAGIDQGQSLESGKRGRAFQKGSTLHMDS